MCSIKCIAWSPIDTTVTYSLNLTLTTWMCSVYALLAQAVFHGFGSRIIWIFDCFFPCQSTVSFGGVLLSGTLHGSNSSCLLKGRAAAPWEPTCSCEKVPVPPSESPRCLFQLWLSHFICGVFFFPRLCSSDIKYTARWSNETVFSSILISPKMITDHMPDVVLKALNSLSQEHGSCLSCQTREYNPSAV